MRIDCENFRFQGWFYFVPIHFNLVGDDGFTAVMRWTGWFWPIRFCVYLHNALCVLHQTEADFVIKNARELDAPVTYQKKTAMGE